MQPRINQINQSLFTCITIKAQTNVIAMIPAKGETIKMTTSKEGALRQAISHT